MSKQVNKTPTTATGNKTGEKIPQKSRKTTREIMSRHISNKDDVISEEEFKNLNVLADVSSDTAHEPLEISESTDRPKDEDKDPKIVTPWDVIN